MCQFSEQLNKQIRFLLGFHLLQLKNCLQHKNVKTNLFEIFSGFLLEPLVIRLLLGVADLARAQLLEVVRRSGNALLGRKGIQDCKELVRGNITQLS